MALKPFVDRLGYVNVPQEINRLRCGVNYHALKFRPEIQQMADLLASRMRNRTGSSNPYIVMEVMKILEIELESGWILPKLFQGIELQSGSNLSDIGGSSGWE
ncbi:hypothetical protein ABKV19_018285 [Rosa sericea]